MALDPISRTARPLPRPAGPARPRAAGKFLYTGDDKLDVRGATYGTFRPGWLGVPFPEPAVVRRDFAAMARTGLNAVRTYTVPPEWLLDDAWSAGLRVMVGIPWEQHVAFLDDPGRPESIERRVREGVLRCLGHPAVLCYAVGNEIPSAIVRWSGRLRVERHIRRLYDAVKGLDPEALVTYANYPTTEYLDLPFLDVVAFNVYLESTRRFSAYLARLHNRAGDRPLLMAELGVDSRTHGLERQAQLLHRQVRASLEGGCAGSFVFAWTDEWHRGEEEVTGWDFGLTTRDRRPKPALESVRRAFAEPRTPRRARWPRVSVVVCVYNGEKTLADCLEGTARLDYPDFEVIVVDDGSTDQSARIASGFDVRLIRTENRGLSRARNAGIQAATGEIVAFLDADARPDPDWLAHLALTFRAHDVAGVGGPNVAPVGEGMVAECVGNAPGGPAHVLSTDLEAEHIPGCNMAFRKKALEAIGGFDPRFRVAGDDVDVCWRIQERGWRIGFSPGALVWHHPRATVGGYWRQQCGYGAAEAQLEAKWPEKYNVAGHVTWGGRIYGPAVHLYPLRRSRIYSGTWGDAPFQRLEHAPPGFLGEATAMPEWYLALALLLVLSVLGLLWSPLLLAGPLLLLGLGLTAVRALGGTLRARYSTPAPDRRAALARHGLTAALHLLQPLARLRGRFVSGLVPWRVRTRGERGFAWPRLRLLRLWREVGEAHTQTLGRIERHLAEGGAAVRRGGGWDDWDLEVEGGALGRSRLRSCVEWHGGRRQIVRFALAPRWTGIARGLFGGSGMLSFWALWDGAGLAAAVLGAGALVVAGRALWEAGVAGAALAHAIRRAERVREDPELPQLAGPPRTLGAPGLEAPVTGDELDAVPVESARLQATG